MTHELTTTQTGPLAVILGSAFYDGFQGALALEPLDVMTRAGRQRVWRREQKGAGREAYFIFRHGAPHRLLPHQINWRAQALALRELDVGALLITSSVGVMDSSVPINCPLLVKDLLMPSNTLPDGSACTLFVEPEAAQGHLVIEEGLFSSKLNQQLRDVAARARIRLHDEEVVFAYVGGPRTKTPAENRFWAAMGAQVNSMTVGPEVVLANELEIPCAALVSGHKRSTGGASSDVDGANQITASLDEAREALTTLILNATRELSPVPFGNHIYRFG